ncbi:hypothetical protein EJ06DRAFT_530681 [Trichodelitschia bisporula]|uniref:Uncharacterized protein n=1 Tax=Trichodelitschia bisporula TaxID=703511 RepID=A0A6G1HVK2_9PEZI|nr:hypothetical protein EJ06DRAFT_530681 [Trichodelitschia bisporula]
MQTVQRGSYLAVVPGSKPFATRSVYRPLPLEHMQHGRHIVHRASALVKASTSKEPPGTGPGRYNIAPPQCTASLLRFSKVWVEPPDTPSRICLIDPPWRSSSRPQEKCFGDVFPRPLDPDKTRPLMTDDPLPSS